MSIPPCLLHLRIHNEEHNFGVWLPLFLAWLILAALLLALLPLFILLFVIALPFGWGEFMLQLGPRFYNVLCALKGFKVDINRRNEQIAITFV